MDERISGLPMTDPHKRVGNSPHNYKLDDVKQQVRQVDGGTWKGMPKIAKSHKEVELIRWIKIMRKKDQSLSVKANLGEFVQQIEDAYLIGRGDKK